MSPVLAIWESPVQLMVVGLIALLLFGKRLPEVMRGLGKGIMEFKKGMSGLEDEFNRSTYASNLPEQTRPLPLEERPEIIAPKFQPPTTAPTAAPPQSQPTNPA
jgi:sec-independent protein translocase protein TatA